MKTITSVEESNELLQKYIRGNVQICMFNPSLKRLGIMIESPKFKDVLCIISVGCKFIKGNFEWPNADILIEIEPRNEYEIITRVIDKKADFLLVGDGGFALIQGSMDEFSNSSSSFFNF